jgi:hypothetical protein
VIALFGLTACGTVLIVSAMPRELQPAAQVTGTATGASLTPQA